MRHDVCVDPRRIREHELLVGEADDRVVLAVEVGLPEMSRDGRHRLHQRGRPRVAAEAPDRLGPSVTHPAGVVQRTPDPAQLFDLCVERMIWAGPEVVLVEPGAYCVPELGHVHAEGRSNACGMPESCAPLRRMKVIARVRSRHPSSVRT